MPNKALENLSKHLGFRFPIARLSEDTGYSKGAVSEYYNEKKEISKKFILKLEETYNINFENFLTQELDNSNYLKKIIEDETIKILEMIPKEKIMSYMILNERDFQKLPSFEAFIENQHQTAKARKLAKEL